MILTSLIYLFFLAGALLLYYLLPLKHRWIILLLSSIVFYIVGGFQYIIFILITTISVYAGGRMIASAQTPKKKKGILAITLLLNFGILAVLKYSSFFASNVNAVLNLFTDIQLPIWKFALPLGISFYTFQTTSYLIDVYRELYKPQHNLAKFALFSLYFPTVMQGPISKYNELEPQLYKGNLFNYDNVKNGLIRLAWGFFKKLVIADRAAILVDNIFNNYQSYQGLQIVLGVFLFAIQLYADFSGYMDMVIGTSKCFGVTLTENFNTPFFSCTIQEYWRRWHITLGAWLKEYILYPVQRSRFIQKFNRFTKKSFGKKAGKKLTLYLSLFILWFTVGLWHGASWNFIIGTGLLHWVYIVLGELTSPFFQKMLKRFKIRTDCFSYRLFQRIRTFTLVCIGFVFFRAQSTKIALEIFKNVFSVFNPRSIFSGSIYSLGLDSSQLLILIAAIGVLFCVDFMQIKKPVLQRLEEQNAVYRWLLYYGLIIAILLLSVVAGGSGQFIYQQF